MLRLAPLILLIAVHVYGLVDCLSTDEDKVRTLPKPAWMVALLIPVLGAIGWFMIGRPREDAAVRPRTRFVAPDDDPEFLASLSKSNQEHEDMLKRWEDDLKHPEQDLRGGDDPEPDTRPKD